MSRSKTEEALARSAALRDRARMAHIDSWEEITSTTLERRRVPAPDSLAPEKTKLSKAMLTLLLTLVPPVGMLLLEAANRLLLRLKGP